MSKPSIFICYAKQDSEAAKKLYQYLQKSNFDPWLDEISLIPGQKWETEISRAIKKCRYFLALLSSRSVNKKGFVQKEIAEALKILDEFPESSIFVIPIRLDQCEPSHERLSELYPVDLFPSWEAGMEKLLGALNAEIEDNEIESDYEGKSITPAFDKKYIKNIEVQITNNNVTFLKAPIKILFLCSDPTNTTRLRLGEESREIQEKIKLSKYRGFFEFHQYFSTRPEDLSQALLDFEPQIVHFSGHGTEHGELCFEDKTGMMHPIPAKALSSLFQHFADTVKCVILNACFSKTQAKGIAKKINYVIGMNKEIGDQAAIAFSVGLYQALGAGRSIEEAYKLGCVQISLQGINEELTPIFLKKK